MRGGLDDALDKLARRDELRRRTEGQPATTATPPAVTELVEAVAAVVARHPELRVTMGVEGAGTPTLLRFAAQDGMVQVTAEGPIAGAPPAAPAYEAAPPPPYEAAPPPAYEAGPPPAYEAPPPHEPAPRPAYEAGPPRVYPDAPTSPAGPSPTDRAATRLAALLREDPSLLHAPRD